MVRMLLCDGVKYFLRTPQDEENLEDIVREHSKEIFGEATVYFDLKHKLTSKTGIGSIPDAYVIDFSEPCKWFIVEVELASHPVDEHIMPQLNRFMRGIRNADSQKEVSDAIHSEIDRDKMLKAFVEAKIGSKEVYRFLSDLISNTPQIIVVIDEVAERVTEALKAFKEEPTVIELKTFVRENAENVHIHLFEPLCADVDASVPGARRMQVKRLVAAGGEEPAERHIKRLEFWDQLLENSKKKTNLFSRVSPSKDHWISAGAGVSGVVYQYVILKHDARIQLAIESGDTGKNKKIFDELHKRKEQIEADYGEKLTWERLDNKKSSYIISKVENRGLRDTDAWPMIIEKMVDAMIRFEKALAKNVKHSS